jgi:hypothetical protein
LHDPPREVQELSVKFERGRGRGDTLPKRKFRHGKMLGNPRAVGHCQKYFDPARE